ARSRRAAFPWRAASSALGPTLLHELVELRLVAGFAQLLEKVQELAVLVLEPLERFGAIGVERGVSGGCECVGVDPVGATVSVVAAAEHAFAPDHVGQDAQADGPDEDESEDHGDQPGRLAALVEPVACGRGGCRDPVPGRGFNQSSVHTVYLI